MSQLTTHIPDETLALVRQSTARYSNGLLNLSDFLQRLSQTTESKQTPPPAQEQPETGVQGS